jgi:hypothetical protein
MLFLLTGLVASLTVSGNTELKISRNYEAQAKARAAAEAGINHAVSVVIDKLRTYQTDGYSTSSAAMTALLKGPDGLTGTTSRDADNGSLEGLGSIAAQRIPRPPTRRTLSTDQSYEARVFDDDDAARGVTLAAADVTRIGENSQAYADGNTKIVVRAVGYGPNNAQVTIEAVIGVGSGDPAILVNGDLDIAGNAQILGTSGSVHANGDLDVSGSPDISGDATATGSYHEHGHPSIGGVSGGNRSNIAVTDIFAADFFDQANYVLTSAGTMTNPAGTVLCTATGHSNGCSATGWSFSDSTWRVSGNSMQGGTYYSEEDVVITGSPGPVSLTVITEGSLTISGNLRFSANTTGLSFVAEQDMVLSGHLTQTGSDGQILVREQLDVTGNPTLFGQIIVQNEFGVDSNGYSHHDSEHDGESGGRHGHGHSSGRGEGHSSHNSSGSSFSGSFSITYNGGLGGASSGPSVLSWRQM